MDGLEWPAEMHTYNEKFTKMIEAVKRRHDPVVTTVGRFKNRAMIHPWDRQATKGRESSPTAPSPLLPPHPFPFGL